jgi:hypothetical protein
MNTAIGSKEWMETRTTDPARMSNEELAYWQNELTARIANLPQHDGKPYSPRHRELEKRYIADLSDITDRLES